MSSPDPSSPFAWVAPQWDAALFEALPLGITVTDLQGRITYVNPAQCKLLGRTKPELLGSPLEEAGDEPAAEAVHHRILETTIREGEWRGEIVHHTPDGSKAIIDCRASLVRDPSGRPVAVVRVGTDISARKLAEEALRGSEERFNAAFQFMPVALGITTLRERRFLAVNKAFEAIYGYTGEDLKGRNAGEIGIWANPEDREKVVDLLKTGRPVRDFEAQVRRKDGRLRWVSYSGELVQLNGVECLLSGAVDITERKEAQEKLLKRERQLRESQEAARIGSWSVDVRENTLDWSDQTFRLFDKDPASFSTSVEYFLSRLHPEDRAATELAIQDAMERGASYYVKPRIINETGRQWVMEAFGVLERDESGEPLRFSGTAQDITERQRAEASLQRSEQRLKAIFDAEPECVKLVSPEGILLDMNPAGLAMLEVDSPDQAIGKPVIRMVLPEHHSRFLEISQRAFQEGSATGEFEIMGIKGTRRWMDTHVVPLRDEETQTTMLLAVTRDVTARKKAQDALREAVAEREQFFKFFQTSSDLMCIADPRGAFLKINPAFTETLGYSEPELLSKPFVEFIVPEDQQATLDEMAMQLQRGYSLNFENRYRCKDGSEKVLSWRATFSKEDGITFATARDITERVHLEEERRQLEAQLNRSQKMESLGSLAGGVAHDMNNVLAAILSLANVHQIQAPEGSALRANMDTITRACLRGRTLVQGLLGFARQELTEEKVLDLNMLVREEVALLERTTMQKVRLAMDLAESLRPVKGDPAALSHALMNLCVNAVDAMPEGGTLTLRTRNQGSSQVILEVIDTGCGMAQEVLDRALDPFFTTKPQGKGTGLGLPLVYGTVKAHRGQIDLRSAPGVGTTAAICLPACEDSRETPSSTESIPTKGRALQVLVVDDDELIQQSTGQLLEVLGHRPVIVGSGEEALSRLEEGLNFDLVILDLNMPGLGGAATLPRIRALRPDLPVLLATGRADQEATNLMESVPNVKLLAKPYSLADLRKHLEEPG